MYLWLSHLMLAPFELRTLSTSNSVELDDEVKTVAEGLPEVATDVLSLAFASLCSPSKERESAVILLTRLALRKDMQALNVPQKLVQHVVRSLLEQNAEQSVSVYDAIGPLSMLYSLVNLGSDLEVGPFLASVFQCCSTLMASSNQHHVVIRDSAPARKLIIKILRGSLIHAIALMDTAPGLNGDDVNTMLE